MRALISSMLIVIYPNFRHNNNFFKHYSIYTFYVQCVIIYGMFKDKREKNTVFRLSSTQTIFGSFFIAILFGTLLLMLPISSNTHEPTDFLTSIFTSTSAMCVTGLVVVDTATHWSLFGQFVILTLIQIGGLGIILVASMIAIILGQKINLIHRTTLQEALSVQEVGGIVRLTKFIVNGVIIFELTGAFFLFIQFIQEFDFPQALWYSIFHSISAFCNAGFDLMGFRENYSSFTHYQSNILVNVTLMSLITIGGIGFVVWNNVVQHKFNIRKYSLQSKIAILTSLFLIIVPAIYFYFFEYANLHGSSRTLSALFQSVTTRTAGFNTADFSTMSEVGQATSVILMLIGGSPGSTAGGMKTTTIAILIISTFTIFRQENEPHIFNRRIEVQIIKNAITIFMLYISLFLAASFFICKIEDLPLLTVCFEVSSAIGTVGLSHTVTPTLSELSRVIIIFLMFFGRVGGLTFIYAIVPNLNKKAGYISEKIAVG